MSFGANLLSISYQVVFLLLRCAEKLADFEHSMAIQNSK